MGIKSSFLRFKNRRGVFFWIWVGFFLSPFLIYGIWQAHDWLVNDGDLVVAFGMTSPSYSSCDTSTKHIHGFDYSIAYFLAQRLHKNLKIKNLSLDESMKDLKAGAIDLVCASLSITDERLANMAMVHVYGKPEPYMTMIFLKSPFHEKLSALAQPEAPIHKIKSLLKDAPVGFLTGSVWALVLKKYNFNNIKNYTYEQDIVSALESGKISAAVIGEFSAKNLQKRHPNIQVLEVALDAPWSYGGGIAIKKGRTDLIKNVTEVIQDLKDEGIIRLEQQRWFGRVCS